MKISEDVIVIPYSQKESGRWVAYNVAARTSLGLSSEALAVLGKLQELPSHITVDIWETEWFANGEGTVADPTRFMRDTEQWKHRSCTIDELLRICREHFLLIDDEKAYRKRFQAKTSVLDREHFGNFHQQVGQYLLLQRRIHPSKWWLWQKFDEECKEIRKDNLYSGTQYSFLQRYFAEKLQSGQQVLDLGCGTGVYANLMATCGAQVVGVDPSKEYLEIAQKYAIEGTTFKEAAIGEKGGLDFLPDEQFDIVFMSDALLFYFVPINPDEKPDIRILFNDIRRVLKPGGVFISVEPHPAFYLNPWMGSDEHPFTILTEYAHPMHRTVPPFSGFMKAVIEGGFIIQWMDELYPDPAFEKIDRRAYTFAKEFPLWQLVEARKV